MTRRDYGIGQLTPSASTLTLTPDDTAYLMLSQDDRVLLLKWLHAETGYDPRDVYSITLGEGEVELELAKPRDIVCVTVRCPVKTLPPVWPGRS